MAGTSFESHTPGMARSGCSTTAAATTGPARQPRPTSSTPATCTKPTRRSAFSSVRIASGRDIRNLELILGVLHPCRLAFQIAQIIQLRAPHLRRFHDFHFLNRRRVQRKNPFDALAERHLPHGERGACAAAVEANHDAFEDLDAFLIAFT